MRARCGDCGKRRAVATITLTHVLLGYLEQTDMSVKRKRHVCTSCHEAREEDAKEKRDVVEKKPEPHEPSFMVAGNRLPTPDRRREFKCPECGEVVVRLANPLMGKRLVCRGTPRKEVVRG